MVIFIVWGFHSPEKYISIIAGDDLYDLRDILAKSGCYNIDFSTLAELEYDGGKGENFPGASHRILLDYPEPEPEYSPRTRVRIGYEDGGSSDD